MTERTTHVVAGWVDLAAEDAAFDLADFLAKTLTYAVPHHFPGVVATFTRQQVAEAIAHPGGSWRRL